MKVLPGGRRAKPWFAVLAALTLLGGRTDAQVDSGLPPSPAFSVAHGLQIQAEAAWQMAAVMHNAGNPTGARAQRVLARTLAAEAIGERGNMLQGTSATGYSAVLDSHLYARTTVGAVALLNEARLYKGILNDPDKAAESYKVLEDNYSSINYPGKAQAASEARTLAIVVDHRNRTTYPNSILYACMDGLVSLTGRTSQSYWLAIVMISVIVKLLVWPLSNLQYRSLKETQKLQPYIADIKAKYKNDPETQGKKTMELYKEHGVNPMAGCLPMLVQMPLWYVLIGMIRVYQFQWKHGTFLWIGSSLAHVYPTIFASDLSQPDIPMLAIYAFSMWISMRMTVPADPQQAETQKMMSVYSPALMAYFFLQAKWPSAFLLYYLVFNVLSMVQQKLYMGSNTPVTPAVDITSNGTGSTAGLSRNGNSAGDIMEESDDTGRAKVHPKKKRRRG
ncbi:MAG: YidC/Oxa1 family membrane protein insertase [Capsulimonadaceae bacterium]